MQMTWVINKKRIYVLIPSEKEKYFVKKSQRIIGFMTLHCFAQPKWRRSKFTRFI